MRGTGEDRRYAAMRRRLGDGFDHVSLFSVFLFQGLLMWIVSLPVQLGQVAERPDKIGVAGVLGVGVWAVGMFFEAVGDWQLARFKSKPWNAGRVMETGLWRYTRHPNYFGDFCVWWGIFIVAATSNPGMASVPGPLLMTALLMKVSGVPLTERHLERRPGYAKYVERTNAFFPGPPAGEPERTWE
jgi:steroid 5-alpha reductase family enzyme